MVGLGDIRSMLAAQFTTDTIIAGAIDRNSDQCIGVFTRQGTDSTIAIGGVANSTYRTLKIAILIHWSESATSCETKAEAIFNFLQGKSQFLIGSKKVYSVVVEGDGPISIDRDERNICEMVIHANFVCER